MGDLAQGSQAIVSTESTALNLRGHPVVGDNIVGSLPRHSIVRIDGPAQGGFYPVTYGSQYGFASATYLTHYEDPAAPPAPAADPVPAFVDPGTPAAPADDPVPPFVPGVVVADDDGSKGRRKMMLLGIGALSLAGLGVAALMVHHNTQDEKRHHSFMAKAHAPRKR